MGIFNQIVKNSPKRSFFSPSYEKKYTCKFGQMIPTMCDEFVPGDVAVLGNTAICRLAPMNAPVLDEIILKSETFFVPYRLLWPDFEKFITGVDTSVKWSSSDPPEFEAPIPCKVIRPRASYSSGHVLKNEYKTCTVGSLQDYFGFPVNLYDSRDSFEAGDELSVNAWPWLAYYKVWNDYYRDENLEDEIDIAGLFKDFRGTKDLVQIDSVNHGKPLNRSWKKDYFTSALPFRIQGTPPALPVFGDAYADFSNAIHKWSEISQSTNIYSIAEADSGEYIPGYALINGNHSIILPPGISTDGKFLISDAGIQGNVNSDDEIVTRNNSITEAQYNSWREDFLKALNSNTINSGTLTGVDISQLRFIVQVQRWLEANARGGKRYTEFLRMHFNCSPTDERLDRAEFIGSTTQSIVVSEVLQTAQHTGGSASQENALGAMAGHGLSVAGNKIGKYRVKEFGIIITLTTIYPKASYQQGINRQWLKNTKYDFLFPEFTSLSEQNILDKELYVDSKTDSDLDNETVWGYQGRYDEYRSKQNLITGHFRSNYDSSENSLIESGVNLPYSLDYWHLGRFFGSKPELNKDFINIDESGDQLNRIFVVPSEDYCLVSFMNFVKVLRPLPYIAVPGGL